MGNSETLLCEASKDLWIITSNQWKSRDFNKGSFTTFQRFATLCQWTNVLPNLISVLDILMTQNICSWFVKCVLLMSELSFCYLFKYWPAGVTSECVSWTSNQRITLRHNWFRVSEVSPITIHLFLPVKMGTAICKFYGSGFWSHRVQLFLAVQNSSFYCLILQIGVSYHIILIYYLNYEHTGL